jgi:plastocyanin
MKGITVAGKSLPCASPQATTVTVQMFDFGFLLSKTTVPCGTVTFNITNTGQAAHTFDVEAIASNGAKAYQGGKTLLGNEMTTQVVTYTRTGTYQYKCDIHGDEFEMKGTLAVN